MNTPEIVITGLGLVTPLGRTVRSTWDALLAGGTITKHTSIPAIKPGSTSRASSLAIEAAEEAIIQSGWTDWSCQKTALVVGTSKGAVEDWLSAPKQPGGLGTQGWGVGSIASDVDAHFASMLFGREQATHPGDPHARQPGFSLLLTHSAACASGLLAFIRGCLLLAAGETDRVLVVSTEASVHPLFIASFNRLGVLANNLCRPFDRDRDGFLMSDAAAAICLERTTHRHVAVVDGFATGASAAGLTGVDQDGKLLAGLLRQTIGDQHVDLVHAHGTGTVANDAAEISAFESAGLSGFLYSHKAALGHSLGSSGLVSLVLNCLMQQTGIILPNPNLNQPIDCGAVTAAREQVDCALVRSIAIAAGFGGPTAVVGLRSP